MGVGEEEKEIYREMGVMVFPRTPQIYRHCSGTTFQVVWFLFCLEYQPIETWKARVALGKGNEA